LHRELVGIAASGEGQGRRRDTTPTSAEGNADRNRVMQPFQMRPATPACL